MVNRNIHLMLMSLPRFTKKLVLVVVDALALVLALWSAFALGHSILLPSSLASYWQVFLFTPIAGIFLFARMGLYRAVLRHIRITAVRAVLVGVGVLSLSVFVFSHWFAPAAVPISITIIFGLTSMLYVGGTRLMFRAYYRWVVNRLVDRERVLIYGAGGAGVQLAKLLEAGAEYLPVGFTDDDSSLWGSDVFGLRVYEPDDLHDVIDELNVTSVLIALPSVSSRIRAEIAQRVARYHTSVKTIPSMPEIISGASLDKLRDMQLEDLLGRNSVEPLADLFDASLEAKVVCITGAGGSIGSELARQALRGRASSVLLVEQSEYALYAVEQELSQIRDSEDLASVQLVPVLLTVLEQDALQSLLTKHKVHTVYHAAAYKHVPIVEANPFEGVRNNSLGTLSAARAAGAANVKRFVLISTDKAVRPTNVMGASKRLAELILQSLASKDGQYQTIYSMVRFGNVLGSSGSVVPLFTKQIAAGGPVTVTHPKINRYFMTIGEAASLVIQAGAMAAGGEVFVLDMGEPVRIVDLAERMIRLSGFEVRSESHPDGDIEIVFTGLRPGEKLFEELLIGGDISGTGHPKIMCAEEQRLTDADLALSIQNIERAIKDENRDLLSETLVSTISGYKPAINAQIREQALRAGAKVVPLRSGN